MADLIEVLNEIDKELGAGPWCKDLVYSQIRHVDRNCDIECMTHTDANKWDECRTFGRYDGPRIVRLRNSLPALIAHLEAAQDLRDYPTHPEFLEADADRRERFDTTRAALAAALGSEGEK